MLLLTLKGELQMAADQMLVWLEDIRNTHRRVLMRALLAFNLFIAGNDAGARAAIGEAATTASALGCKQCDLTLHMFAAEILAQLGDDDEALRFAALARESGERVGRRAALIAANRADAVVALRNGQPDKARPLLNDARRMADELRQPFEQ